MAWVIKCIVVVVGLPLPPYPLRLPPNALFVVIGLPLLSYSLGLPPNALFVIVGLPLSPFFLWAASKCPVRCGHQAVVVALFPVV